MGTIQESYLTPFLILNHLISPDSVYGIVIEVAQKNNQYSASLINLNIFHFLPGSEGSKVCSQLKEQRSISLYRFASLLSILH